MSLWNNLMASEYNISCDINKRTYYRWIDFLASIKLNFSDFLIGYNKFEDLAYIIQINN